MQSEPGKLFIGGISWDTSEERVKEYFSGYGEVLEAVIMKDRTTGRARGFGFVVFANPTVAEKVIKEKHNIDGRMVEAKKAVPRDDQSTMSRSSNSIQGSPAQARTRKIFVGGLASTVTENDFKNYFGQFGKITDMVVMYDQNTHRPRGFGFITYDSEDAVDKVLLKTFHELNGKMVEVKRAVPKDLSPSPSRTPLGGGGYNYGLSRINNFINGYNLGYSPTAVGGFGRINPLPVGRSGFNPIGSGLNFEPGLSPNPYYSGNLNQVGFDGGSGGNSSFFSSSPRNLLGNGGLNSMNSSAYVGSASGGIGGGAFGNSGVNWRSSPILPQGRTTNLGYGKNSMTSGSHMPPNGGYDGAFADFYGDATWRFGNLEREEPGSIVYGLGGGASDFQVKSSPGYVGGYSVTKRQINRGIAG